MSRLRGKDIALFNGNETCGYFYCEDCCIGESYCGSCCISPGDTNIENISDLPNFSALT